jgi:hypothetical protein
MELLTYFLNANHILCSFYTFVSSIVLQLLIIFITILFSEECFEILLVR